VLLVCKLVFQDKVKKNEGHFYLFRTHFKPLLCQGPKGMGILGILGWLIRTRRNKLVEKVDLGFKTMKAARTNPAESLQME
jgi:hypothetical protein